jgi:uncharacterized membrane protein
MTQLAFARSPKPERHLGWLAAVVLCSFVGLASMRYLAGGDLMTPPPLQPNFHAHPLAFYIHIGSATVALLIGPWQFLAKLRLSSPRVHRTMGAIYILACLTGGLAALVIAPGSNGGWVAASGFATLAVLWLITTGMALVAIRGGRIDEHRRWMRRSFALTFAGVTLRLYLPLAFVGVMPFATIYAAIAWLCWVPNLLLADRVAVKSS